MLSARAAGLAAAGGGIAVAGALLGAILVSLMTTALALAAVWGADVPSPGDLPGGQIPDLSGAFEGANTITFLFASVVWTAALGLGGRVVTTAHADAGLMGSVSIGAHIGVVLLIVLACTAVAAAWWGFHHEKGDASAGRGPRWLRSVITGAVSAAVMVLLTLLASATTTMSILVSVTVRISALTVTTVLMTFVVVTLAAAAGRGLCATGIAPGFWQSVGRCPALLRWGLRDAFEYAVVTAVLFTIAVVIAAVAAGDGLWALLPLLLGQGVIAMATIGGLGVVGTHASGALPFGSPGTGGTDIAFSVWSDQGSPWLWLLVVPAVLAAVLTAILIANRRRVRPVPVDQVWLFPAVTLVLASVVALWAGSLTAGFSVGTGAPTSGDAFGAIIIPATWTGLLAAAWAVVVELLARLVAPTLIQALPTWGRLRVGPRPTPAAATAPEVPVAQTGQAAPGGSTRPKAAPTAPADIAEPAAAVPPRPLSPRAKRGLIIAGSIVGGVIVVVVAAVITLSTLGRTVFSPTAAVEDYTQAIVEGRFGEAFAVENMPIEGRTTLMDADHVEVRTPISKVEVGSATVHGDRATVPVTYAIGDERISTTVILASRGSRAVFFHDWAIETGMLSRIQILEDSDGTATVGGVPVTIDSVGTTVLAYPGTFDVVPEKSRWVTRDPATVTVTDTTGTAELTSAPSHAYVDEVNAQIRAALDDCADQSTLTPEACPFRVFDWHEKTRKVSWKITAYPELSTDDLARTGSQPFWTSAYGSSDGTGTATVTYQYLQRGFLDEKDTWKDSHEDVSFGVNGTIEVDGDTLTVTLGP